MNAPVKKFLLTSVLGSLFLVRQVPRYAIADSYIWTASAFFLVQFVVFEIWKVILYPRFFSPFRHLPQPKGGSFINGQMPLIAAEPSGAPMQRWVNDIPNDGLIRYTHLLNADRLLVTSPKALGEVLVQKNYDFVKPALVRNGLGRLLGIGVLLAEGEEHKTQRKNLMPAFAYRHIKDLYPVFWSKSRELVQAIAKSVQETAPVIEDKKSSSFSTIEMGDWLGRATLDIIGVAGMGQDFNSIQDPNTELNVTYRKVFKPSRQAQILGFLGLFFPIWLIRSLPIKRNEDIVDAAKLIRRTCRQLIDDKRETLRNREKEAGVDIISVALESGGFSNDNLVDQMMTFVAAGHETTATASTWMIYLLCKHPAIQTRLRNEIRDSLPSVDDPAASVTADMLDRLPYLHAVCNEVLRVYPPAPLTLRVAARDTSIVGQFVPKGTTIILAPWAINMSKDLWGPDAADFNPDRWMGPGRANTGGAASNYSFMTFLHGPRSCIGMSFAKAEFACLMAAIVGKFEMEWATDQPVEIQGGITAKPKGRVDVRLRVLEGW